MVVAWLKVVALEIKAFEFRLYIKVQSIGLMFGLESGYDERVKNKTESYFLVLKGNNCGRKHSGALDKVRVSVLAMLILRSLLDIQVEIN